MSGSGYDAGFGGFPPPPPLPPRRRRGGLLSHLAVAVTAAAVGAGAALALSQPGSTPAQSGGTALPGAGAVPVPSAPASPGGGKPASEQAVIDRVAPGVVLIDSTQQYHSEAGAGTGMVINSDGLVLTNNHVIENSTKLTVTVPATGKTYRATVLGYSKTGDIALIKLSGASGLPTVPLGDSNAVKTGDKVVALGNAEGQGTVIPAAGLITGTGKTITANDPAAAAGSETLHGMLGTNANIVSGDSGGPLANAAGQVIGMDTAGSGVSTGESPATQGFAIPINTALSVARQIAAGHASATVSIGYPPFIGIFIASGSNADPRAQAQQQTQNGTGNPFGGFGFGPGGGSGGSGRPPSCYTSNADLTVPTQIAPASSGTLIDGVICGSPAAAAGMTGGAVITAVNGRQAGPPDQLSRMLGALKPGDTASITWVSPSGRQTTSTLHLVAGPPQ